MSWDPVAKILIAVGLVCLFAGVTWQFGGPYLKLGRLPGDIAVEKENFKFYFPLTTSILLSVIFTLVAWLWRKWGS